MTQDSVRVNLLGGIYDIYQRIRGVAEPVYR